MVRTLETVGSRLREEADALWRDGRGWILVTISLGWFLSIGLRFVYPALAPYFQSAFELDLATVGLLLTVLWGAYSLGQFPGGVLGDRVGEGNVLVVSTAVTAVAVLAVSGATSAWMLFASTVAFGFATALYGPTRYTVFTDIYTDRAGTAIGLTMAAGSVGNAALPVVATAIAAYASWRLSYGLAGPLFVAAAVALWLVVPSRTSGETSAVDELSASVVRRVVAGITREGIPVVVAIQVFMSFVFQGFSGFYPTYLIEIKGLSPAAAATLFGVFFAAGAVVQPLAGVGMDQLGPRIALAGSVAALILCLLALPLVDGYVGLVALSVALGSMVGYAPITQTFIASTLPTDMKGTGLGMLRTGWMLVGATSPVLIGVVGDRGYLVEAFLALAVLSGVALVLAAFVPADKA